MRHLLTLSLAALILAAGSTSNAQERRPLPAEPPTVAPEQRPASTEEDQMVVYDVSDLCEMMAARRPDKTDVEASRQIAMNELVELVRANIDPGHNKIAGLGTDKLVVLGSREQQQAVGQFLADLRQFTGTLFDLQFTQVTMSEEQAVALGLGEQVRFMFPGKDSLPATIAKLAAEDAAVDLEHSPRVLTFNAHRTLVSTMEPVHYISGYARYESVEPTGQALIAPIVEFVEEGTAIDCKATLSQQNFVTVEVAVEFKQVHRPIERRSDALGVSCQPTVSSRRFATTVVVPADGSGIALPAMTTDGRTTVLLMRVRRVEPESK